MNQQNETQPMLRGKPQDKRLMLIIAEGLREKQYFRVYRNEHRANRLNIEPETPSENKSAPNHLIEAATIQMNNRGFDGSQHVGDTVWFISDADEWTSQQMDEVQKFCAETNERFRNECAFYLISNPCFEVWLHHHHQSIDNNNQTCVELKGSLNNYHPVEWIRSINQAIQRSKQTDTDPHPFKPGIMQTRIWRVAEELQKRVRKPG